MYDYFGNFGMFWHCNAASLLLISSSQSLALTVISIKVYKTNTDLYFLGLWLKLAFIFRCARPLSREARVHPHTDKKDLVWDQSEFVNFSPERYEGSQGTNGVSCLALK